MKPNAAAAEVSRRAKYMYKSTVLVLACAVLFSFHIATVYGLASPLPDELRRAIRSSPAYYDSANSNGDSESTASFVTTPSTITISSLLSSSDRSRSADAPDETFYSYPMIVNHNDDAFRSKLSALYSEVLPQDGGGTFLDLGSSWVSHLPDEPQPTNVWLHGMNAEELERNPAGNGWKIVRSFNDPIEDPIHQALLSSDQGDTTTSSGARSIDTSTMLLPEIPDASVDVVGICAAFQYWRFPERVVGEILRVLKPEGTCVVSFSNRMFQSKAVGAWMRRTADRERIQYVSDVLTKGARILDISGSQTSHALKVERTISDGSTVAALTVPLSMMMGYQVFGDPFLAVVANKQPSSR